MSSHNVRVAIKEKINRQIRASINCVNRKEPLLHERFGKIDLTLFKNDRQNCFHKR